MGQNSSNTYESELAYKPMFAGGAKGIQSNFDSPRLTGARAPEFNSLANTLGPEFEADFGIDQDQGFDFSGAMGNFALGAEGIAGLANAYNAWQQTGLMKDQLNMQKNMANRNISNQAAVTNEQLAARAKMQSQMTGKHIDPTQVSGEPIA